MDSKRFINFKYILVAIVFIHIACSLDAMAVKFYSINSLFSISSRVTNSICKDDNGFVWASSKTGILRLTDTDYRIYQLPYETAGVIVVKLIYQHSQLIAYTNNGQLFAYDPVFDRFTLMVDLSKSLPNNGNFDVYSILIDHSGSYWIATDLGLYKFYLGELTLVDKNAPERYSITWLDDQHLIIAKPSGIWSLDISSLESKRIFEIRNTRPFLVSSLFLDKVQNKLWIGTFSNGLYSYHFGSSKLTQILHSSFPRQPILAIEENSQSTLLVGIDGQGVWEIDKQGNKVLGVYKENVDDPTSLPGNGVYDIFYEQDKRVWVGTISGGVSFYELASPLVNQVTHQANNVHSLVNNDVNGLLEDRDGKIWFATNNGISCWDVASDKWNKFYFNKLEQAQVFLTLCEDDQGRIWAGSYSSGIYVLDGKTGKELAHISKNEKDLGSVTNFIFDIFKDSVGDLWIGGINGKFFCYLSKEDRFRTFTDESISSFAELSPNQILLGGSNAIKLLDKQTGVITDFLLNVVVQDMVVLGEFVWIATSGEGLVEYNYKDGTIRKYTTKDALPSNFLNSIIYADNYLWIGTESGMCRFNPIDKTANTFSSIFQLSGLSYNKSALFGLKDGQLAWGTNNGAIFFAPQAIRELSSKGKIFFQDLTISGRSIRDLSSFELNKPVDSLETLHLNYSQNTINLELISIGMQVGSKFSWKLEGFDKEWSAPSANRIITYTNIPSGAFILKIKMFDSSLSNVINERSIAIHLIPPFWRKGWFWALIIIALSGIILLYLLYYINRLKQEHTEEKVRFFTNTAHDIRTSLTLIKAPVEELSKETNLTESGKYYLNLAIEQARQLSAVVTQLMDFQKVDIGKEHLSLVMTELVTLVSNRKIMLDSYAKSKNIELIFVADRAHYTTAVDESKMVKIIDNLISNAIKYAHPNSQIQVDLRCDDKKWMLQVKDNGIGITKKAQRQLFKEFYRGDNAINSKVVGSGIGLLLVKNYVAMHKGTISCSSQENVGSTFQVHIPFKFIPGELVTTPSRLDLPTVSGTVLNESPPGIAESELHPFKEIKVLLVEDNDELLYFMKKVLCDEFKVITASDGVKAWGLISRQLPDLVVSDIMMPGMDGFELCRIMKSTYETSHIPLVLLTALSETTHQLQGLGLGADDYLTKPFDMNLLVQRIKSIVHNREVVREKALKLINSDPQELITSDPHEPILTNELNDQFVRKMLEVAKANISNTAFDKDEFASAMNVSTSLLYKKVKALTDQSPTDLIKSVRLNHAMQLLQSRQYTVTEVSEMCGFASIGYFSTVFRKQFGKSPTQVII